MCRILKRGQESFAQRCPLRRGSRTGMWVQGPALWAGGVAWADFLGGRLLLDSWVSMLRHWALESDSPDQPLSPQERL